MNSLDQVVNLKVKITDLLDVSLVGTIYAFSPSQEVLAIKVQPPQGKSDEVYKIINTSFIKSLQVLPHKKKPTGPTQLRKVDTKRLEEEVAAAVKLYPKPDETRKDDKPAKRASPPPGQKKHTVSALAGTFFDKFIARFGKENVQWHGNEAILLFREVSVSKPYALNKVSNSPRAQASKHIDKIRTALREIWLEMDNAKRGG